MPTYEYECKSCGHNFDVFQNILDEPLKTCPECGKEVRRLINGGTGVIFKGGGFYVTDKGGAEASHVEEPKTAPGRRKPRHPEAAPVRPARSRRAVRHHHLKDFQQRMDTNECQIFLRVTVCVPWFYFPESNRVWL